MEHDEEHTRQPINGRWQRADGGRVQAPGKREQGEGEARPVMQMAQGKGKERVERKRATKAPPCARRVVNSGRAAADRAGSGVRVNVAVEAAVAVWARARLLGGVWAGNNLQGRDFAGVLGRVDGLGAVVLAALCLRGMVACSGTWPHACAPGKPESRGRQHTHTRTHTRARAQTHTRCTGGSREHRSRSR